MVKYLARERDRYKEKLEKLIPYTKSLERKVAEYQHVFVEYDGNDPNKEVAFLRQQLNLLKEENRNLVRDYKKSNWYKSMMGTQSKLAREKKQLMDRTAELSQIVRGTI